MRGRRRGTVLPMRFGPIGAGDRSGCEGEGGGGGIVTASSSALLMCRGDGRAGRGEGRLMARWMGIGGIAESLYKCNKIQNFTYFFSLFAEYGPEMGIC